MNDHIRPSERLARLSPSRWQTKLALLLIAVALVIALMCDARATEAQLYTLVLCPTGNSIAQRYDVRDSNGQILQARDKYGRVKRAGWIRHQGRFVWSGWRPACVPAPRVIYASH